MEITLKKAQKMSGCETKNEIRSYFYKKGYDVSYSGKERVFYIEPRDAKYKSK